MTESGEKVENCLYQIMAGEWQNKVELVLEAVSHEDVLDGGARALVRLHEGHLVGRQAVTVSSERTAVASPWS